MFKLTFFPQKTTITYRMIIITAEVFFFFFSFFYKKVLKTLEIFIKIKIKNNYKYEIFKIIFKLTIRKMF